MSEERIDFEPRKNYGNSSPLNLPSQINKRGCDLSKENHEYIKLCLTDQESQSDRIHRESMMYDLAKTDEEHNHHIPKTKG